jgi:hypothetical protein
MHKRNTMGMYGRVEAKFHAFLTSAQNGSEGQTIALTTLLLQKIFPFQSYQLPTVKASHLE